MAPVPKPKELSKEQHINAIAESLTAAFQQEAFESRLRELRNMGAGPFGGFVMFSAEKLLTKTESGELAYKSGAHIDMLQKKARVAAEELYDAGMRASGDAEKDRGLFAPTNCVYMYDINAPLQMTPKRIASLKKKLKDAGSDESMMKNCTHITVDEKPYDLRDGGQKRQAAKALFDVRLKTEFLFDWGLTNTLEKIADKQRLSPVVPEIDPQSLLTPPATPEMHGKLRVLD